MNPLIDKIRQSVIGARQPISTPFGRKPLVYADYTASGRSLTFIEDYIRCQVLPWYANTHTETSFTGAQTTALRAQIPADERPLVFIGPYEHHSNELPWRESIADVESIPLTAGGQLCLDTLERKLREYSGRRRPMWVSI